MWNLYKKKIRGNYYWYAQRGYRVKLDPISKGKGPGSGKSKVVSEDVYLGTADQIVKKCKHADKPLTSIRKSFGLEAALYSISKKIGLCDILCDWIPGVRFGLPRWLFIMLCIINRVSRATSKARMGKWAKGTVLPELLGFDHTKLNSKSYWYVTDDILSESDLQLERESGMIDTDDPFAGIDDQCIREMEIEVFKNVQKYLELPVDFLFYDTTNFFTFFEPPFVSELAHPGHNKKSRHHLRQIGVALAILKDSGIPMMHSIYKGNCHDSRVFPHMFSSIISRLSEYVKNVEDIVIILDKGNNSKENFYDITSAKIHFIGSLVPSHYTDLLRVDLSEYESAPEGRFYYTTNREVFGKNCQLVLTYNPKLAGKQEQSMQQVISKARQLAEKENAGRKTPVKKIAKTFRDSLPKKKFSKCYTVSIKNGKYIINTNTKKVKEYRQRMGKNLIFTDCIELDPVRVIDLYKNKDLIENDFKLLHDPELIRIQPVRHWTDTKIRVFVFCCVMALLLIKILQKIAADNDVHVSAHVLKDELADLQQIFLIYPDKRTNTVFTERSTVQQKLWDIFELQQIADELTQHLDN